MWDAPEDQGLAIGVNKGEIIVLLDEAIHCKNHDFREPRNNERSELRNSKYRFFFLEVFAINGSREMGHNSKEEKSQREIPPSPGHNEASFWFWWESLRRRLNTDNAKKMEKLLEESLIWGEMAGLVHKGGNWPWAHRPVIHTVKKGKYRLFEQM